MRYLRLHLIVLAASLAAFAGPASATSYYCYAFNAPDSGPTEVIVSNTFERSDSSTREAKNDWYRHLRANGWKFNMSDWGCLSFGSRDSAGRHRRNKVNDYRSVGWEVFYSDSRRSMH